MIGDCEFGPQSSHVLTFLAFPETKWRKKNYLRSRNLFPKYFMGLGSQIPLQMSHIYFYTRGMCFLSHPYLQVCSRVAIERSFHCTVLSRGETFRLLRTNGEGALCLHSFSLSVGCTSFFCSLYTMETTKRYQYWISARLIFTHSDWTWKCRLDLKLEWSSFTSVIIS